MSALGSDGSTTELLLCLSQEVSLARIMSSSTCGYISLNLVEIESLSHYI